MKEDLTASYRQALSVLEAFCQNSENFDKTAQLAQQLASAFQNGNKILICGNGGSACDAMHFAEELTGRFQKDRRPLPALALSDAAHITCVANDFGFDTIFSRGVEAYGKAGDWLIALSTSGNSANIIKAVTQAKKNNLHTLALLGKDGGKLKGQCDEQFIIPAKTSDRIQELHMLILHTLVEGIERELFPENYA